jgi:hypothetical protein
MQRDVSGMLEKPSGSKTVRGTASLTWIDFGFERKVCRRAPEAVHC